MAAPYNPPVKGEDFVLRVSLSDMAMPGTFKANPSLAAGDFKVDKDGYGLAPLAVMPVVQPAGSVLVVVTLTPAEMAADVVTIVGIDQSFPKEWADFVLSIPTSAMASTVHVASAIYLNDEMALQPPFADSAIGGGTIQALPPTAGAASAVARDGTPRAPGTIAPIHMVSGGEMDLGDYSLRMTNIGGGFSAGAVDSNMVSVWLDDNWVNSEAEPAPLDASVPSLILQPEWFVEIAKWHTFYNDFNEFDRYLEMGWWDKTALTMTVGFYSNYETGEPGAQPDMVFASMAANRDPAPQWKFAFSNGNHFVPAGDNVVDIGDPAHRVREVIAGTTVDTPTVTLRQAGLFETGDINVERTDRDQGPMAVLSASDVDMDDFGYPGFRYRMLHIGTNDPWNTGEKGVDANVIYFYASADQTDTPPDPDNPVSSIVGYIYPSLPGSPGYVGFYGCELSLADKMADYDTTMGWDNIENISRFNIRVGFWNGSAFAKQVDLTFSGDDRVPQWTMAFSNGNHLLPGTDNLQDIGDPTHRVRAVHAGSLAVDSLSPTSLTLPEDPDLPAGDVILTNLGGYMSVDNNHANNYSAGLWLMGGNTVPDLSVGSALVISGGTNGWAMASGWWGEGVEALRPIWITANWRFDPYPYGSLQPQQDNKQDLGSHTNRLRDVHVGTSVSTPRLLLSDTGGTTSERGDTWRGGTIQVRQSDPGAPEGPEGTAPPLHMMSGGIVINGTEGYKWRQLSIGGGGGGEFGGSGSDEQEDGLDANTILFFLDDDSTIDSQPNGGRLVQMMGTVGSYFYDHFHMFSSGPLSDYESSYGGVAWSEDKSFFQLAVAGYGAPKDLAFCSNMDAVAWRVSHSTGGHFIPETDNTLDIGSPEKRVRRVHTDALMGDVRFRDDTTGAPHWSILHSQGSHLTPEVSNTYDIGTEAYRVRDAYVAGKVSAPSLLLETKTEGGFSAVSGGSITSKGCRSDNAHDSSQHLRLRWADHWPALPQLYIGGGLGYSHAANYIGVLLSNAFIDPVEHQFDRSVMPNTPGRDTPVEDIDTGIYVMSIQPQMLATYGAAIGLYDHTGTPQGIAQLGWDNYMDPTLPSAQFNFEVGALSGGVQKDLVFCSDGPTAKWRMAHSTGSHLVPETDKTLDIGSLSNSLRSLFASCVHMPVSTPAAPTDGDIWFDGAALMMQVGGVPKAFAFAP